MTGILKRKFEAVEGPSPCLSLPGVDDEVSGGSDSGNSSDSVNPGPSGPLSASSSLRREKRMRGRCVRFEGVTVFYFLRRQGFTSVPTQGGSTLGMSTRHSWVRRYSLGEFALEQERSHRDLLREHLKQEKLNSIRLKLTKNNTVSSEQAESLTLDDISEEDIDLDNTEVDDYFFLQPLTTRRRRALLRASGVRRIDVEEKQDLRALRVSREECGCDCRGRCDPRTCACSLAGIKCQVDRMSFPCGCSKEGCSNATGRVEFNPVRVRTHFLHTIMKLQLESSIELQHQPAAPQTPNGNGYHGDPASAQRSLQYHLTDVAPRNPIMHLQTANETDQHMEEEEEEDDDDNDEEDDEEEYEDDDDEDGSSLCSGLSDCSTHSLETSEEEEGDEEEEENWEGSDEGSTVPPVSHTEVVPLSSVLGFSRNTLSNYTTVKSYYHPSTEYYHMASSIRAPPPANPHSETTSLPSLERDTLTTVEEQPHLSAKPPHTDLHPQPGGQNGCHHGGHDSVEPTDTASSSSTWEGNTAPCGETVEMHQQTRTQNHWSRKELPGRSAAESEAEGSLTSKAEVSTLPDQNSCSVLGKGTTENTLG
ncbi:cysteine/serine-rich nuclear protein 3-like [Osmerus mordax]|uniref:cysteine/serine-rich nuclear protein 3-like n=1 Tax=Osmerus mordax TaxID=8014 RepID=UPI00350F587B